MNGNKKFVFELRMINSTALKILKKLEREGIIKRVNVNKDGSLDKRMTRWFK